MAYFDTRMEIWSAKALLLSGKKPYNSPDTAWEFYGGSGWPCRTSAFNIPALLDKKAYDSSSTGGRLSLFYQAKSRTTLPIQRGNFRGAGGSAEESYGVL